MTAVDQSQKGISMVILAMFIFAIQDAISLHLSVTYNVYVVVMLRYWFFAAFVLVIAQKQAGGIMQVAKTSQPVLQIGRGVLLVLEICVMLTAFTYLGLVESLAVFSGYPLLVAALSGPILGETVGWRRWVAIIIGFVGILIILQPGFGVFQPAALIAFGSALMFSVYSLLTRYAARRDDTSTSFFWTGIAGSVLMTIIGIWFWEPMSGTDYFFMLMLCISGATGHWLLIRCYEITEASTLQPFVFLHLVFGAVIGVLVFGEVIRVNVAIGACIVIAAGLFTLWRERLRSSQ